MTAMAVVPARVPVLAISVPLETVVVPVKVLTPERVSVPAADLAKLPLPERMAEMVPAAGVTLLAAMEPEVEERVPEVSVTLLVMLKAPRASVPPLIVTVLVPKAAASPAVRVPAETVVAPE